MVARTNKTAKASRDVDEAAFLTAYDPGAFDRPAVTVDVVLLTVRDGALFTLVVRRTEHPFMDQWALPGGFVQMTESLEQAAARVLATKCALDRVYVEQFAAFGDPSRDPRMRVVSIAYVALVDMDRFDRASARATAIDMTEARVIVSRKGASSIHLEDAEGLALPLAFDHEAIVRTAIAQIRAKLDDSPIGFQLLPERFTLHDLKRIHEAVLGRKLNKDSFRRRMLRAGALLPTGELESDVGHRPAERYRFGKRSAV